MNCVFRGLLVGAVLLVGGCRAHDFRTIVIMAPGVQCEDCAQRVGDALAALADVEALPLVPADSGRELQAEWEDRRSALRLLRVDPDSGAITVTYDSMKIARKNFEFALAAAGYAVEAEPFPLSPDEAAYLALPPECREHLR